MVLRPAEKRKAHGVVRAQASNSDTRLNNIRGIRAAGARNGRGPPDQHRDAAQILLCGLRQRALRFVQHDPFQRIDLAQPGGLRKRLRGRCIAGVLAQADARR